jgi:hypothetical protein
MAHKLREAMGAARDTDKLDGVVEVDGAYFGGYVKPANERENRRDRRLAENQTGKRQVVVVMRERDGRTLPVVTKSEAAGVSAIIANVDASATVHADEASAYDALHARFLTKRINHSVAYSLDGACTNMAESFFSRMRRAEVGIHHRIAGPYLDAYATKWRGARTTAVSPTGAVLAITAAATHPGLADLERDMAAVAAGGLAAAIGRQLDNVSQQPTFNRPLGG